MFAYIASFLVISILLSIYRIAFNVKSSTLGCGIFGFCGKPGLTRNELRVALQKFKILGIYNESRGKDSCGIYVNSQIKKGINATKLFSNFIETEALTINTKDRVFLGHNRQASTGSIVNEENQHPFLIEDDMLLTHNGTLKETFKFCEKYNLPWVEMKVDTVMLATALYHNGSKVLENYKGAAALAYTLKSKPNSLYLYHGKSKNYKNSQEIEERPLHFMEAKEGIYYSSVENGLEAIREEDTDFVDRLEYNEVFEIIDGRFTGNNEKIERGDINVEPETNYSNWYGHRHYGQSCIANHFMEGPRRGEGPSPNFAKNEALAKSFGYTRGGGKNPPMVLSISRESLPSRLITEKNARYIYYYRGRNYIHVPDGDNIVAHGLIWVGRNQYVKEDGKAGNAKAVYFYRGHEMKDKEAFDMCEVIGEQRTSLKDSFSNFAHTLSKYTKHPIFDVEKVGQITYKWYKNEKPYEGNFSPLGSDRTYVIELGYLSDIKSSGSDLLYYETIDKAEQEYALYLNGGLLTLNERKNSNVIVDAETNFNPINDYEFYNKIFDTEEEAMRAIGKYELKALNIYSEWFLSMDVPFKFDKDDIYEKSIEFIKLAVRDGLTLEEVIGDTEGFMKLVDSYNEIVKNAFNENKSANDDGPDYSEDENHFQNAERPGDVSFNSSKIGDNDISEENMTQIIELCDAVMDAMEEISESADELQGIEVEDAQELAVKLYRMLDEFKDSTNKSEILNRIPELKNFLDKVKNLKNGVI